MDSNNYHNAIQTQLPLSPPFIYSHEMAKDQMDEREFVKLMLVRSRLDKRSHPTVNKRYRSGIEVEAQTTVILLLWSSQKLMNSH